MLGFPLILGRVCGTDRPVANLEQGCRSVSSTPNNLLCLAFATIDLVMEVLQGTKRKRTYADLHNPGFKDVDHEGQSSFGS